MHDDPTVRVAGPGRDEPPEPTTTMPVPELPEPRRRWRGIVPIGVVVALVAGVAGGFALRDGDGEIPTARSNELAPDPAVAESPGGAGRSDPDAAADAGEAEPTEPSDDAIDRRAPALGRLLDRFDADPAAYGERGELVMRRVVEMTTAGAVTPAARAQLLRDLGTWARAGELDPALAAAAAAFVAALPTRADGASPGDRGDLPRGRGGDSDDDGDDD